MNIYNLTLVLKPDLQEKEREDILEKVTKSFAKKTKEDIWGNRDLVYPIKKQKKGWYAHFTFEAEPNQIPTLDKQIKLEEDIIRYLLIKE